MEERKENPERTEHQKNQENDKKEIIKTVVASVLCALLVPWIVMNITLIVKKYVLKDNIPDIFGRFAVIVLVDDIAPVVRHGDLVICREMTADDIRTDDMIVYTENANDSAVYMQSVEAIADGKFILQAPEGYENPVIGQEQIVGIYHVRIPVLGAIIYFLSSIPGFLLCVAVPIFVLTELYIRHRHKEMQDGGNDETALLEEQDRLKAEYASLLERSAQKKDDGTDKSPEDGAKGGREER